MRIEVTQADIDEGRADRCFTCPIALALSRATGIPWAVFSGCAVKKGTQRELPLPSEAKDFIYDFDSRKPVAPFSFDLDLPTE